MTPRIVYSPIGESWFVVTRYVEKTTADGKKYIKATTKYDVTDQMRAILSQAGRAAVKKNKKTLRIEV